MSKAIPRVNKELTAMVSELPANCSCGPKAENLLEQSATIMGPEGSVYQGGLFFIEINIPADYPFKPPTFAFQTKIYHPSVSADGKICVGAYTTEWKPAHTIAGVIQLIYSSMASPSADQPLNADIGAELRDNKAKFEATAREWTRRYAS